MILACDQYEQTIRLAWGEDPESVEVEEYEVQEEALRRVQELAAEAEKIVISQESSFAGEPQKEERAVSRIRRLEAVYCGLRGQVNGDRCLILSIGQDSCFGGVVQDGCLIDQRLGSSNLTLRYIASQLGEKNSQLMQALKGYYEGNASDVQAILLQELSKSLRGKAEPSFFFHSLSFPQLVKLLSIPLKEQIQELLIQLDPQRNIKTLICTDWAATGALAELLQDDYHVVCSPNDPLTDAVRGLVLFGWAEAKKASTARAATFVVRVREKLDAVRRRYPLIEVAAEIRRALLPLLSPTDFKSLSEEEVPYIEYAEGWDALLRGMDQLGQQGSTDLEEQAQRLLREAEGFAERAAHLTRDHRTVRLLPFLERAAQLPAADEQFERLKDLLGVEDIPVKVETEIEVKDLGEFYVTRTKGTGKRIIVEEVIERGYREKATGAVIRRPKVAVRLEEGQEEETKPASQFGQETPQVLLGPADHREEEKEPVAEPFLKVNEGVNREERRKGEKKRRVLVPLLSLGTVVSLLVGLLLFPVRHPELPQPTREAPKEPPKSVPPETPFFPPKAPPPAPPVPLQDGREYIRQMIAYAAVDGGMYQESGILAAKRDIEELRDRRPAPLRNRKEAKRRNEMGLKLLRENNIVEAFKAFWAGYQADPTDVEIANNLGYAAVLNNDLKTAEQFLIATLLLAPDRGNAWANLGQTYAKQGKTGDAVACFAHAYRFSRDQRKTYQFLRKLAEQDDDARVRSAAAQALQLRLIQLPADNIATAAPLPSPSPPPPSPSSSLTEEIESQLRREGIYNVNVHRVSESTIRLVGTVNSLEEQKRAIAIAQKIVKRTGVLFFIEHEITPGRPRAREKRERDQQAGISPEPSKTRGGIQRGAGRERTELSGPSETTASVPLPSPSEEVSNLTKETDAILKSVSPVSKDAAAAFAAAEVSRLTSLGRRLERLQRLRLETFSRQGLQAHQQKRYREAIEAYETLLTIDPDNFAALFNLAGAYYELNQPDTTIEYAIRAIRRNADPGLYFVVASAYVKKGDKERAFSWLERAIKGGFADRAMIQENFATLQNEPVYRALMQRLS